MWCRVRFEQVPRVIAVGGLVALTVVGIGQEARMDRVRRMFQSIDAGRGLSADDRRYTFALAERSLVEGCHDAINVLSYATLKGVLPKTPVLALIERRAKGAERLEAVLFSQEYAQVLEIPPRAERPIRDAASYLTRTKRTDDLDAQERQFLVEVLSRRKPQNDTVLGRLLISKRGLGADAKRFGERILGRCLKRAGAREKPYWRFVRRVFLSRNPAR